MWTSSLAGPPPSCSAGRTEVRADRGAAADRLLLGADGLPGLPAGVRDRPRRALHQTLTGECRGFSSMERSCGVSRVTRTWPAQSASEPVETAARYRLWEIDGRWPALIEADDGVAIVGELYEIAPAHLERLAELEPPGWQRVDGRAHGRLQRRSVPRRSSAERTRSRRLSTRWLGRLSGRPLTFGFETCG